MIRIEANKINHIEYLRFYSDTNRYIKIIDTDEMLTEVVVLSGIDVDVAETNMLIETQRSALEKEEDVLFREILMSLDELREQVAKAGRKVVKNDDKLEAEINK